MTSSFQDSIVLIISTDPQNKRFGTGFVVHQDEQATYILTCSHVVDDMGGLDQVRINGRTVNVSISEPQEEIDLVILQIEGLLNVPPIRLQGCGQKGLPFVTAGFQLFGKDFLIRPLHGVLGEQVSLAHRTTAKRVDAWDLKIVDDYNLQPGYSGSPVIDENSGSVFAVVSHRQGEGRRGLAISITALEQIWVEMPSYLLESKKTQKDEFLSVAHPSPGEISLSKAHTLSIDKDLSISVPEQIPKREFSAFQKSHVFLCYSHIDTAFVENLERDLSRSGISIWRNPHSTHGDTEWYKLVVWGIQQAYALVAVVTPALDASPWTMREILYANQQNIPIIPVLPKDYRIPLYLNNTQPIFCDGDNYITGLNHLANVLKKQITFKQNISPFPSIFEPNGRSTEISYLNFLLSDLDIYIQTFRYIKIKATSKRTRTKVGLGLKKFRRPSLKRLRLEKVLNDFTKPGELIADSTTQIKRFQRVLLLGTPGSGKTTTIIQLVYDMAHEASEDPQKPLPVYVSLRSFQGNKPFTAYVKEHLTILQGQYNNLIAQKRLFFFFDAFNEMPSQGPDGNDLIAEVVDFLSAAEFPWVISCRERDYLEDLSAIPNLVKVKLKPLDPPQIKEFIQKHFQEMPANAEKLWKEMRGNDSLLKAWDLFSKANRSEAFWDGKWTDLGNDTDNNAFRAWYTFKTDPRSLMSLCRNPYMLFVVCEIFDTVGRLPENRGVLFATFVDELLDREKELCEETGSLWIDTNIIREILDRIAYDMLRMEVTVLDRDTVIRQVLTYDINIDFDPNMLFWLATSVNLLQVHYNVSFTHQLLQEYFASERLGRIIDLGKSSSEIWPKNFWWKYKSLDEAAILLAGYRDPVVVASWIAKVQPLLAERCISESGYNLKAERQNSDFSEHLLRSLLAKLIDSLHPEVFPFAPIYYMSQQILKRTHPENLNEIVKFLFSEASYRIVSDWIKIMKDEDKVNFFVSLLTDISLNKEYKGLDFILKDKPDLPSHSHSFLKKDQRTKPLLIYSLWDDIASNEFSSAVNSYFVEDLHLLPAQSLSQALIFTEFYLPDIVVIDVYISIDYKQDYKPETPAYWYRQHKKNCYTWKKSLEIDRLEFLYYLRANPKTRQIPFLIVTSWDSYYYYKRQLKNLERDGIMDNLLRKPFSSDELIDSIKAQLSLS